MKKILFTLLIAVVTGSSVMATQKSEWPQIPYSTRVIGQFMSFCERTMNLMAATRTPEEVVNNETGVRQTHSNICACIIDNFRLKNEEAVFMKEFKTEGTAKDVPLFSSYFQECAQINNNIQILKNGL